MLLACFALTIYFAYHALHGRHGFEVRQRLLSRSLELKGATASLEAQRRHLQGEVDLLSETSPNSDFVEELARTTLGFARPGDQIVLHTPPPTKP